MTLRSILALSFTAEQIHKHYGIDIGPLLTAHGLNSSAAHTVISQADELSVLAALAPQLAHDPLAPVKLGSTFGLSGYGAYAMLLMSCATVYEAVQLGIRYQEMSYLFSRMSFSMDGEHAALILEPCPLPAELQRFIIDRDVAGTFQFLSLMQTLLGQQTRPLRVDIPYPEPAEAAFYRQLFQCPVQFGSPVARFVIPASLLRQPLPNANRTALALYRQQCDELLQQRRQIRTGALAEQVKKHLQLFHAGFPDVAECAATFGYSERQFRRLLQQENQRYQQLLDEVRHAKACHVLTTSQHSVEQITLQLGYTEAAAFIRAFRKWQGETPAQYRKRVRMAG